jgi:S1-C subfamily serine protease
MRGRYPFLLLGLSIVVLAVGTLVRRRAAAPKPEPEPVYLEILQRLTADRRLRDLSAYLAGKAHSAARRLSSEGMIWDAQTVIAPPDSGKSGFTVRRVSSSLPPVAPARPRPGDWLLAVARDPAGEPVFTHGLFEGVAKERCGSVEYDTVHLAAPLAPGMIGGGVFLLDGGVTAFIGTCNGRPVAIASSAIADAVAHPPSVADRIEEGYGFRRDDQGLVTSVWEDSDAARAGLRPGDIVDPAADPPSQARRGSRTVTLQWLEERPLAPPPVRGLSFEGAAVTSVAPGSPGAAAGILPGDLVPRIGGRSVTNPAAILDRAKGPITITIERNGRRRETLLQP